MRRAAIFDSGKVAHVHIYRFADLREGGRVVELKKVKWDGLRKSCAANMNMAQRVASTKLNLMASNAIGIKATWTAKPWTITKYSRRMEGKLKSDIFPSEIDIPRSEPVENELKHDGQFSTLIQFYPSTISWITLLQHFNCQISHVLPFWSLRYFQEAHATLWKSITTPYLAAKMRWCNLHAIRNAPLI